jgi:hypothetical protein
MPDKELMVNSFSNNTFNLTDLEDTLREVMQNSFNYLYNLQLLMSGYKRFDFKMNQLLLQSYINNSTRYYPRKYILSVDAEFIDKNYRLKYRGSEFFNKELTIFDVANNYNIFANNFMVFVDGKLFDTINLLCKEDKTYIIFDLAEGQNTSGIPKSYFDELMAKNADITVFFIPNCSYGIYNTNIYVLKENSYNLSLQRFNLSQNLNTDINYITFVNNNNLLFSSVITDTDNSEDLLRFYNNLPNEFDSKLIHLNVFGFRNLLDQYDIAGTEKYFQIPIQDMPVPKENVMIFKNINGKKYFAHNISLKMYYPNIYEIIGNTDNNDLTIYVFYCSNTELTSLKYNNELSLYYAYTSNILDKYKDNTIPDIIKYYNPSEYTYRIKDYQNSESFLDNDILKYKIEKLKSWVNTESSILKAYLYNQMKSTYNFYIDVSKIDLSTRYRVNNYPDLDDNDSQREEFTNPHYVFIFKNEESGIELMRFFIDGRLFIPSKMCKSNGYDYYYIPIELVKTNSIIEIEKFNQFFYSQDLLFVDINTELDISIYNNDIPVYANDIFLVRKDNKKYISRNDFNLIININGEITTLNNSSFCELKDFKIKILNNDLVNIPLILYVKKRSYIKRWNITTEDQVTGFLNLVLESNNIGICFRIFRNGYLVPSSLYNIDFGSDLEDALSITVDMKKLLGDEYIIDCTPNKYKQIYYKDVISDNGFMDLKNIIDKPFDLKWYDIYMNGLKLNRSNIEILTPYKIIIKNINTKKNLQIIQKNRDDELIKLNPESISISDNLFDQIPELQSIIFGQTDDILDTMDDIITEILSAYAQDLLKFFQTSMQNMLINPDLTQISDDDVIRYPSIFLANNILPLNADITPDAESILFVNPKIIE